MTQNPESQWFGEKPVSPEEKTGLVRGVFDSVADKYDLMNDLMSGGIHRLWKDRFVREIRPRPGLRYLDVAGGTGDIAFRIRKKTDAVLSPSLPPSRPPPFQGGGESVANSSPLPRGEVSCGSKTEGGKRATRITVCDLNEHMLSVGRDRAMDRGYTDLDWVTGNAEALPLPDSSVDVYTIAFGLRNVTRIDTALTEAFRVLKPGGRFFCLEFSRVDYPLLSKTYDIYSFGILPRLGEIVAKDRASYQYLAESIRKFPPQKKLAARMELAGFEAVGFSNLSAGIAAIHRGLKS